MTKKNIFIDSNVFLNDALAMYNFGDNNVIICDIIRTEVNSKRNEKGAVGKFANDFGKEIYKLTHENPTTILTGAKINIDENDSEKYGTVRILLHKDKNPKDLQICMTDKDSRDHLILSEALKLKEERPDEEVIIVSDDLKFGADCVLSGITHEIYKYDKLITNIKDIYKGYTYVDIDYAEFERIEQLLTTGKRKIYFNDGIKTKVTVKELEDKTFLQTETGIDQKNLVSKIKLYHINLPDYSNQVFYPNEFIIFRCAYEGVPTARELIVFINYSDVKKPFFEPLRKETVSGLRSKSVKDGIDNIQQDMFIHLSKSPHVEFMAGLGPAGSGKTLLAVASACEETGLSNGFKKVTNNDNSKRFSEVYVSRTYVTIDKDLGALPGTEEEKVAPLFRPIQDNLKVIMNNNSISIENLEENVNFLTFSFLQGRSIDDASIILDEAQNTHIVDVESFVTRSGVKTRIYLTGDPLQVRKPGVGPLNNGLTQTVELFKGAPFFGVVYMQQAVRSIKAEYANILLNRQ